MKEAGASAAPISARHVRELSVTPNIAVSSALPLACRATEIDLVASEGKK